MDHQVRFGTLGLTLNTERLRTVDIKIGIIGLQDGATLDTRRPRTLTQWVLQDEIGVITGSFGARNWNGLAKVAEAAGSTVGKPLCQEVFVTGASNGPLLKRPNTFFIFGRHDKLKLLEPSQIPQSRRALFGADILQSITAEPMPTWQAHHGASNVLILQPLTMKKIDSKRCIKGKFQSSLWIGAARPSARNQIKEILKESQS